LTIDNITYNKETRSFIPAYTTSRHLSLCEVKWHQSAPL